VDAVVRCTVTRGRTATPAAAAESPLPFVADQTEHCHSARRLHPPLTRLASSTRCRATSRDRKLVAVSRAAAAAGRFRGRRRCRGDAAAAGRRRPSEGGVRRRGPSWTAEVARIGV